MKAALLSMMGLGAGGAAYFGIQDPPDFDRIVNRPQMEVYEAFSALAQEGSIAMPDVAKGRRLTFTVTKVGGESIDYQVQLDDQVVAEAELSFASAGEDGRQTRMTAEADLDEDVLGSALEMEAGMALSMLSDRIIDREFAKVMGRLAGEVEARRPLTRIGMDPAGLRRAKAQFGVGAGDFSSARHDAGRPMARAAPMVDPDRVAADYRADAARAAGTRAEPMTDPNRAAAAYRDGSANPTGGWGR